MKKFQNLDRQIQFKIKHPDNTEPYHSYILKSNYHQQVKFTLVSMENPPLKTFFVHFKSALPLSVKTKKLN